MNLIGSIVLLILFSCIGHAESIFDKKEIVKVSIKAPFKTLFDYRKGKAYLEVKKFHVDGELSYDNGSQIEVYKVRIKMKGKSTLTYCSFPKLELKFLDNIGENKLKNIYFNIESIDIGTHCIEKDEESDVKFITPVEAPHRESFLYQLAEKLNIPTFNTQSALIHYYDNSESQNVNIASPDNVVDLGVKNAFFLEDMNEFTRRLNAKEVFSRFDNELRSKQKDFYFENLQKNTQVSMESVYNIYLFEALIGNGDWYIKSDALDSRFGTNVPPGVKLDPNEPELWNVKMIKFTDDRWLAFPYDFNLTMTISGKKGGWSTAEKIKKLNEPEKLIKQIDEFLTKKQLLLDAVEAIKFDTPFYNGLIASIHQFYENLERLKLEVSVPKSSL